MPTVKQSIVLIALVVLSTTSAAAASTGTPAVSACAGLREQDQLWLVSNRGLGCNAAAAESLHYWRYDSARAWVRSSKEELLAADDAGLTTTIFVHGNRIPWGEAFTKGWMAYRALVRGADERPLRFVIWSWPSDKQGGPIEDARIKAGRTDPAGYYLAWFIDQLHPQGPISLWGHSYGARIVTGALHLLGGGQLGGHVLSERNHPERLPLNAVLLVAALDNDWLGNGRRHGQALTQVDSLLLVNNSCDALLKRYRYIYHRRSCAEALGYTGAVCLDAEQWSKVQQIDACCYVGRVHTLHNYLCVASLVGSMQDNLLFEDEPDTESVPSAPAEPAEAKPPETKTADIDRHGDDDLQGESTADDITADSVTADSVVTESADRDELVLPEPATSEAN